MKNKGKIAIVIAIIILFVVGILFTATGIYAYKVDSEFKKNAEKTEAIIEDINVSYSYDSDGERKADHDVYVKFIVDGKTYEGLLDSYSSSMHVGGKTTVYYDPSNPANFKGSGGSTLGIIFTIIGSIIVLIGLVVIIINLVKTIKTKNKKEYLMKNGIRISANIDTIDYNYSYSINGRHPYIIKCSYKDPYTNKIYIFESKNIWFDVQIIINSGLISAIDVYMDKKDPAKYYMDIDSLEKYIAN